MKRRDFVKLAGSSLLVPSTYGQSMQVHRRPMYPAAGGFNPFAISGIITGVEADTITGLSDGDPVTTWEDQSGNNNHFTQSTSAKKPTYKTGVLNSKPVVRYDGTDDSSVAISLTLSQFTIFAVYKSSTGMLSEIRPDDSNYAYIYTPGGAHTEISKSSLPSGYDAASTTLNNSTWSTLMVTFEGNHSTHNIYRNSSLLSKGTVYASSNPGTGNITGDLYLGSRNGATLFFNGDIALFILIGNVVSAGTKTDLDTYANDKYAIY